MWNDLEDDFEKMVAATNIFLKTWRIATQFNFDSLKYINKSIQCSDCGGLGLTHVSPVFFNVFFKFIVSSHYNIQGVSQKFANIWSKAFSGGATGENPCCKGASLIDISFNIPVRLGCTFFLWKKGLQVHIPIMDEVHSLLLRLSKMFSTETFATALHRKFLWKNAWNPLKKFTWCQPLNFSYGNYGGIKHHMPDGPTGIHHIWNSGSGATASNVTGCSSVLLMRLLIDRHLWNIVNTKT